MESPLYSSAAIPTSAVLDGLTVMIGRVPPPAVIGAVQMLCSVPSEADEVQHLGVGVAGAVGDRGSSAWRAEFQMPTSTIIRLPAVTALVGVTAGWPC